MTSLFLPPLLYLFISHLIFGIYLFCLPAANKYRIYATSSIFLCSVLSVKATQIPNIPDSAELIAFYAGGFALCVIYLILIKRVTPSVTSRGYVRFLEVVGLLFSHRIGVANLPKFRNSDPSYTPSRSIFLTWRTFTLCLAASLFWVNREIQLDLIISDFSPEKEMLLRRWSDVGIRELVIKLVIVVMGIMETQTAFIAVHSLSSLVAVGLFDAELKDWPPLFGSPFEAYTVRRYWSNYWHQLMRKAFTGNVGYVLHNVLYLPRSSITRFFTTGLAMLLSGVMHKYTSCVDGCPNNTQILGFFLCFCAMVAEDIVIKLWKLYQLRGGGGRS